MKSKRYCSDRRVHILAVPFFIALTIDPLHICGQAIRLEKKPKRLIYWYGTKEKNSQEAFSFVNSSKIIAYEDGVKKKYDQLADKVQRKIDCGRKLAARETLYIDGLKQMKDDLRFSPIERPRFLLLPDDDDDLESFLD